MPSNGLEAKALEAMNMETRFLRQAEIAALMPRTMDDVKVAADQIKRGNPVIVNLGMLGPEERLWAIHFLNGVIYAVDGRVFELSSRVFLFSPPHVEVTMD
jgi:cell division inhibitor SepF